MIFDSDVLIWALRGNHNAAARIDESERRSISVITSMELLRGVGNRAELLQAQAYLRDLKFHILPLSERIGRQANEYIEAHTLRSGMDVADALIAATAAEHDMPLCTGNAKHFRQITELDLRVFRHRQS